MNEVQNDNELIDWRLTLVNYENSLPDDFEVGLEYIDKTREFDSRAIGELNEMLDDMKKQGINNIWVQSAYRSIEYQRELFEKSINKYINQGKTKEDAENYGFILRYKEEKKKSD